MFTVTFSFDSASQGTLNQLIKALANLTTTISTQGDAIMAKFGKLGTSIDDLTAAETVVANAITAASAAITAANTTMGNAATAITSLTTQLAAALASGNTTAIEAAVSQFDA